MLFRDAISGGVLAVNVNPGSGNPIGGQTVALKCWGRTVDAMVLREPSGMKSALGGARPGQGDLLDGPPLRAAGGPAAHPAAPPAPLVRAAARVVAAVVPDGADPRDEIAPLAQADERAVHRGFQVLPAPRVAGDHEGRLLGVG